MQKKSSIAIFIAATSALAISTADSNAVKSGENNLGGLRSTCTYTNSANVSELFNNTKN